jgi:hypothetical protein
MEQVEKIDYLGTIISANWKIDTEINNRVQKVNHVYYQINQTIVGKKEINSNTKMRTYKMVYLPRLLYDSESWTMLTKHESRITGAELEVLKKNGRQERTKMAWALDLHG